MVLKFLLAIPIIAAVVAAGFFYSDYQTKTDEADTLENKLQTDLKLEQSVIDQHQILIDELSSIEKDIQDMQAEIEEAAVAIPEKMNSNDILEEVLDLGKDHMVSVLPLNSQDWSDSKIGQHTYHVFRMNLSLEGSQENIVEFLREMQSSLYPPMVLEDVSLSREMAVEVITPTPVVTPTELVVKTVGATNITDVSAVLNGELLEVDTHGVFYVAFDYGETDNYTDSTVFDTVYRPGDFFFELTGLSPETTYHFRATVQGNDKIYGADMTFRTLAVYTPPVPSINAWVSLAIYAR
jgi:Tfp pilus assembly protein PilO